VVFLSVGVERFELPLSCSQSRRVIDEKGIRNVLGKRPFT